MLSAQRGDAASAGTSDVGQRDRQALSIPQSMSRSNSTADSNTFIVRLVKDPRVLIFRFSESQVHTDGREAECERTLNRKIKDLWNLI